MQAGSHHARPHLRSILETASRKLYDWGLQRCAAEARALNEANGFRRSDNRWFLEGKFYPFFFAGDPDCLRAGEYFIVLSMNPKLENSDEPNKELSRLNQGPGAHFQSCSSYFASGQTPHSFFNTFKVPAEHFARSRKILIPDGDKNAVLRHTVLALEAIPFFSKQSGALRSNPRGGVVDLNRSIRQQILRYHPPAAIYTHGAGGRELLDDFSDIGALSEWREREFAQRKTYRTGKHIGDTFACRYQKATFAVPDGQPINVIWTPFIRSRHGPGSNEQREELGRLLAERAETAS